MYNHQVNENYPSLNRSCVRMSESAHEGYATGCVATASIDSCAAFRQCCLVIHSLRKCSTSNWTRRPPTFSLRSQRPFTTSGRTQSALNHGRTLIVSLQPSVLQTALRHTMTPSRLPDDRFHLPSPPSLFIVSNLPTFLAVSILVMVSNMYVKTRFCYRMHS